ncbi:hypothetical protein [Hyphomicrobium sp.]|uniref:hypothetical protein n=1 Tax=Hyphomicrobium sp. TaxID=82 RepID=UPI002B80D76D|nr:hypothetical protein [Hyphomicrobium sp.]HRN87279.1 hypothetical protein [Hyphomicrobium sp.]HRQ25963.1 hypothetical protein [Hyphomicrobium sp.]
MSEPKHPQPPPSKTAPPAEPECPDAGAGGNGDPGSLISLDVGGSHLVDLDVGTTDEYSGVSLEVAAQVDQGLLGDFVSDGLVSVDIGNLLPIGLGALPDLPDLGGILDPSCGC